MRVSKPIIKTAVSTVVLLVLLLGAGVGYTWYVGQNSNVNSTAIATPVESKPTTAIKRVKPAANGPVSASVQLLTSPVAPGSNASINVKTNPESKCTISVIYDKTASTDSGLGPKIADDFGVVSWTWTVEASAPQGKWPVKVTCVLGERSAVVQGDLVVKQES